MADAEIRIWRGIPIRGREFLYTVQEASAWSGQHWYPAPALTPHLAYAPLITQEERVAAGIPPDGKSKRRPPIEPGAIVRRDPLNWSGWPHPQHRGGLRLPLFLIRGIRHAATQAVVAAHFLTELHLVEAEAMARAARKKLDTALCGEIDLLTPTLAHPDLARLADLLNTETLGPLLLWGNDPAAACEEGGDYLASARAMFTWDSDVERGWAWLASAAAEIDARATSQNAVPAGDACAMLGTCLAWHAADRKRVPDYGHRWRRLERQE